jgi:thiamine-monophosphate kinase
MMDLSDGLGADLPRLAKASSVGFLIEMENLPLSRGVRNENAISDGEDYELLFAISPRERNRLVRCWHQKFPRLPLTRIGRLDSKSAVRSAKLPGGYTHFQQLR